MINKTFIASLVLFLITVSGAFAQDGLDIYGTAPGPFVEDPGQTIETWFTLENTGDSVLDISAQPLIFEQGSYTFATTQVTPSITTNFVNGTKQRVNITISIPANQYYGDYIGTVEITGGSTSTSFDIDLNVAEHPGASMTDISTSIASGNAESETLTITNTGNTGLAINLTATNLIGSNPANTIPSSAISFSESSLGVAYAGAVPTTVTVTVPAGQTADTYTGTISCEFCSTTIESELTVIVTEPSNGLTISPTSLDIEDKPEKPFSTTLTITNSGTTTLSDLSPSISGLNDFEVVFDVTTFDLAPGETKVIAVSGTIPKDVDTQDSPFQGFVTIQNSEITEQMTLNMYALSQVEFQKVYVYINDKKQSRTDDGDEVDKISPGDTIRITGEVENLYSKSADYEDKDIESVEVALVIDNIDDGDNIEEDLDVSDISPRDQEKFEYEFTVAYNTDEDTFPVSLEVLGEDEEGAMHFASMTFDLKVERERHQIKISDANVDKSVLSCDRDFSIDANVINIGSNTEKNVVLEVKNSALGILASETNIKLDDNPNHEDNEFSKRFFLEIPQDKAAGTYTININAYLDRTSLDDSSSVDILVQECKTSQNGEDKEESNDQTTPGEDTTKDNVEVITPTPSVPDVGVIAQPIQPEQKFTDSVAYILLLGAILLLLVIGVIALLAILFKK